MIAARTTAIRVAPNVANLPLRPPVVLARAAATLDLLSSGRVELGLGAGAFWDAVVAAGGPRRTPKEAVDALVEAIGIIRQVWDGGTVRAVGEHYQVNGLHGGPRAGPRHPDLDRRLQAADAARHRGPGRRLDPVDGVRRPGAARGAERGHRRAGRGQRARYAGDPADVQRLRSLRQRQRLPPGHARTTGPSSSPVSRSTKASAPTSSAPTTPTPSAGSRSRWSRPCASRSTPSVPCGRLERPRWRSDRTGGRGRASGLETIDHPHRHPHSRRRHPPDRRAALGRDHPAALPGAGGGVVHRGAAGLPPAPRRHPRRPARRAHPAARRRRPGAPRADAGRSGPVGDQHDDDAAEQLDPGRLLRVLLPHRDRPPHARGPLDVPAPAPRPTRRPPRSSTGWPRSTR